MTCTMMRRAASGIAEDENGDLLRRRAISGIMEAEDILWMRTTRPA